jgi:hypothetical protein
MSFYLKLGLFFLAMVLVLRLLARFPRSRLSRLAHSWYGPVPTVGELRSQYLWRWCRQALVWLVQVALVVGCGIAALELYPKAIDSALFHAAFLFALPLLAGMALLGAIGAAALAWKARVLGPNPAYTDQSPGHAV